MVSSALGTKCWCLWQEEAVVPVPVLFWGARVSPWAAAAGLPVLCLWAYVPWGVMWESAGAYCCSLESSCELSGTSHSISFKPWRRVAGYFSFFLAGSFPNVFQCFCCCSLLGARACRCMAQPEGLERRRSPAASSDGCGGCKPRP